MIASLSVVEGTSATWNEGRLLRLREVVNMTSVSANTLRRATDTGLLPCYRLPSGARRFKLSDVRRYLGENTDSVIDDGLKQGKSQFSIPIAAVIRVSSHKQATAGKGEADKSSLEHQEGRVNAFIKEKFGNRASVTWFKSIGGGLDFNRPSLLKLIADLIDGKFRGGYLVAQDFTRICRFGVKLIEHLASIGGCKILYTMDETEAEERGYAEQLTDEILSILTHYTARASGEKAKKILTVRVPSDVVLTICTLHKQGYSYRYIAQELERQGKGKGDCGRAITKRICERIVKQTGEGLKLLENASPDTFPASVAQNSFVEYFTANVRLTGEEQCRVRQSVLIDKYREWARANGLTPMTSNSIRKTLRKHFPQLSTKFTDNACIQYTGMTFVNA